MRFVIWSDWHLYHGWPEFNPTEKEGTSRWLNIQLDVWRQIHRIGKTEHVVASLCSGDIFHKRSYLHTTVVNAVLNLYKHELDYMSITCGGNHDRYSEHISAVSILNAIDKAKVIPYGPYNSFGIVDPKTNETVTIYGALPGGEIPKPTAPGTNILLAHGGLNGATMPNGFELEGGYNVEDFKDYSICCLGDIHRSQIHRNVLIPGAPMQHNWGDRNTECGCWLIDTNPAFLIEDESVWSKVGTCWAKFIPLKSPRFIVVTKENWDTTIAKEQDDENYYDFRLLDDITPDLKHELKRRFPWSYVTVTKRPQQASTPLLTSSRHNTTDEILRAYFDNRVKRPELKEVFLQRALQYLTTAAPTQISRGHKQVEFLWVKAENFMPFGNVHLDFRTMKTGLYQVTGGSDDETSVNNGTGKALTLDSRIKTPKGWITMDDAVVGVKVQTPSGQVALITKTSDVIEADIYRVTMSDGRYVDCSPEHLWSVKSYRWDQRKRFNEKLPRVISTLELKAFVEDAQKRQSFYNIFIPRIRHPIVEPLDLPISPYLLGALLGDGGMTQTALTFTSADSSMVERVSKELEVFSSILVQTSSLKPNFCYRIKSLQPRTGKTLRGDRFGIKRALATLGLLGCHSWEKSIPEIYMEASVDQKLELLRGLFDTDGAVGKTQDVSFSSTSRKLAEQVQYLIRSMGANAVIATRKPRCNGKVCRNAYYVGIRYPTPRDLFTLERKRCRLAAAKTQYAGEGLRVSSVVFLGRDKVKCIAVDDPEQLFITNDFITTHNSTFSVEVICYTLFDRLARTASRSRDALIHDPQHAGNGKNLFTEVGLSVGGTTFIIQRYRKHSLGTGSRILVEESQPTSPLAA